MSPTTTEPTKEDGAVAHIVATLGGVMNVDDPQTAIAAYLLVGAPPELHEDPQEAAALSRELASTIADAPPTRSGVSLSEREPRVIDLQFTDGVVGRGGYARELMFRARYAVNAMKRIAKAALGGKRKEQMAKERLYLEAHKRAAKHREQHLALIDEAARQWGDTLSWRSELGPTTTPECRAAHGKNFKVSDPPAIGLPGLVHPQCKCVPAPPRDGAPLL